MKEFRSAPCKDCKDRDTGCHGKCEAYKAYVAENERVKAEKAKKKKEFLDYAMVRSRRYGR